MFRSIEEVCNLNGSTFKVIYEICICCSVIIIGKGEKCFCVRLSGLVYLVTAHQILSIFVTSVKQVWPFCIISTSNQKNFHLSQLQMRLSVSYVKARFRFIDYFLYKATNGALLITYNHQSINVGFLYKLAKS